MAPHIVSTIQKNCNEGLRAHKHSGENAKINQNRNPPQDPWENKI